MTVKTAFISSALVLSCAAEAHPLSPDALRPAPVRAPTAMRVVNPDYLPKGTVETADMNAPDMAGLASDSRAAAAQRQIIEGSGLQPGDCGTLVVLIKPRGFNALMITQVFFVTAGPNGLAAGRIASSSSKVSENADIVSWLNAEDYATDCGHGM